MCQLVHQRGQSFSHWDMHTGSTGDPHGSCANANKHRLLGTGAAPGEQSCCLSMGLILIFLLVIYFFIFTSFWLFLDMFPMLCMGSLLPLWGAWPHRQLVLAQLCWAALAPCRCSQDLQFGHPGCSFTISALRDLTQL